MLRFLHILALLCGGGVVLAEPAPVESPRSGYGSTAPTAGSSVPSPLATPRAPASLQMLDRMGQLQQELQALRNQIEQLSHETEGLKRRQRDAYIDLDNRLSRVEKTPAAAGSSPPPALPPGQTQLSARPGVAGEPAPTIDAAPGSMAPPPPERVGPGSAPRVAADEEARYQAAFSLLKAGRYDSAIEGFQSFLQLYPAGSLADNALYWIGEAYYVTQRFDEAGAEFKRVLELYPQSDKVPDSLLKLGYVHYEKTAWAEARQTLTRLVESYPSSTAARLAENRLARMASEGH
ncbi:MAG: tol-pal system protein YbgF [Gammaproteobacteria bacterium]|nr:tol-pal system protein YbgF [Gammaproteobacteria bacterium]